MRDVVFDNIFQLVRHHFVLREDNHVTFAGIDDVVKSKKHDDKALSLSRRNLQDGTLLIRLDALRGNPVLVGIKKVMLVGGGFDHQCGEVIDFGDLIAQLLIED